MITDRRSPAISHAFSYIGRVLIVALAACAAGLPKPGAAAERGTLLPFSASEIKRILEHGPWPVPWRGDPSNRVSGKPAAIAFGERLFFDSRLSAGGTVACATCHVPERNWTDGRKLAVGLEETDRNTPSVLNARLHRWFGWGGSGDSLWAQSIRPMLDGLEMGMTEKRVADLIRNDREFACRYRQAFGAPPSPADDDAVMVGAAKALAAFQETLVTGRTPFDEFRDALARGDRKAAARYPQNAQRGLRIFVGKGLCSVCHFGPNFTNGEFDEIGIRHYTRARGIDWGRYTGIKVMEASRFNLLGRYNDDASRATAIFSRYVALDLRNYGQFRVPGLRNVALTAPYMHNGDLATLRDVVKHYSEIDPSRMHLGPDMLDSDGVATAIPIATILKPLHLTEREIGDVVAFLESLTDTDSTKPRKPRAAGPACRPDPETAGDGKR